MPRVPLAPKFTYANDSYSVTAPDSTNPSQNNNLYNKNNVRLNIIMPLFRYPSLGTTHNNRASNRITITSLRFKAIINMAPALLDGGINPFRSSTQNVPSTPPVKRFIKMRYFVIQVDDDIAQNIQNSLWFYDWFKRTYCWYREPLSPVSSDYDNAPVSVHSNILHQTTPYIAKFNILCDKCLTLTSAKPQISLDITIPLNKEYCWEEHTSLQDTPNLIYPHLFMFILPPLAAPDLDPITWHQWSNNQYQTTLYFVDSFTKLNFIDL